MIAVPTAAFQIPSHTTTDTLPWRPSTSLVDIVSLITSLPTLKPTSHMKHQYAPFSSDNHPCELTFSNIYLPPTVLRTTYSTSQEPCNQYAGLLPVSAYSYGFARKAVWLLFERLLYSPASHHREPRSLLCPYMISPHHSGLSIPRRPCSLQGVALRPRVYGDPHSEDHPRGKRGRCRRFHHGLLRQGYLIQLGCNCNVSLSALGKSFHLTSAHESLPAYPVCLAAAA